VEHGEEAEFGAEVFGIGTDCPQGLGCGAKQERYRRILVTA
jgi:hypothetical protein